MATSDFLESERRLQQGLKTSAPCTSVQSPVAVPVDGDHVGTNFASRKKKLMPGRHLTLEQRDDISTDLQDSITGAVSMTATASDKEAVGFAGEIASVLQDSGFKVKTDNVKRRSPEQKIPMGVEMTISDETIRPRHAYRIVQAFRRAGVTIATRINAMRRKNNTLYITVGRNDAPALVSPAIRTAATWQSKSLAPLLAKWKAKFAFGLQRGKK